MKKKMPLFFVLAATICLTACGGGSTQTPEVSDGEKPGQESLITENIVVTSAV